MSPRTGFVLLKDALSGVLEIRAGDGEGHRIERRPRVKVFSSSVSIVRFTPK